MPVELIDSHCHLTFEVLLQQLDEVLARAEAAGVRRMLCVGTDVPDTRAALALARAHARVRVAAGIHPHAAGEATDADLEALDGLLAEAEVLAAGEMGLDYHYDFADHDSQKRIFARQLDLARRHDLPVIVHCREAYADAIPLMDQAEMPGRRVVFHCFTGTADEARAVLERGWWLSFTGIITFKNSQALQEIARTYPLEKLMVETDAPYLSPVPVRKQHPNEPAHVQHTAAFLARLRGESLEQLATAVVANAESFFRWHG